MMTVGELRAALAGVDDRLEIVVNGESVDGDSFTGGLRSASVAHAHDEDDTPYFSLYADDDDDAPTSPMLTVVR